MKILVVDNDQLVREGLVKLIIQSCHDLTELQEATGVETGLEAIKQFNPDILFLDVEMDDGTGFDLLNKLPEHNFQLIFTTAFNKYAVNAFKFSAIDFILKPVAVEDLIEALDRAKQSIKTRNIADQLSVLKNSLSQLTSADQKIVLRDNKTMYFVKVNDIFNCEADGSYTTFFIDDGSQIVVTKPLREYESLLEPFGFIRTHNSHVVNSHKIAKLDKSDGGKLILDNGSIVPISQRKWDQVIALLDK